jgi:hypothetical protein
MWRLAVSRTTSTHRIAHPPAGGPSDGRAAWRRNWPPAQPALLLRCELHRSEAAARAMGRVERRDGASWKGHGGAKVAAK